MRVQTPGGPMDAEEIALFGDLDTYALPEIARRLDTLDPALPVLVDLRGARYIEACVVDELVRLRNRLVAHDRALCVLVAEDAWVHRVLALCKTTQSLCVCFSVDDAFRTLRRHG